MDWKECKRKNLIKEAKVDKNLINSLVKSSLKKLQTQALLILNNDTASSKISLAYESLRELLEALAIVNGYKIYNHECYCAFLKEILLKSSLGDEFDDLRKIRNSINYYGKEITSEEAKLILKSIEGIIEKIKDILG